MTLTSKKLIEVALPLDAINEASAREKSIRHGHPSTLHLWWARRPLAAARAVLFAQMVDDPSSHPELFPTEEAQQAERERLFDIIRELVKWENTTNEQVLEAARAEIRRSWRMTCEANKDHPRAAELFNPDKLPAFHDPFAGGGSIPLEAQRLGLEAYASDLNPVAVLINKAMIEIPPKFAGRKPVGPLPKGEREPLHADWSGAKGLAEDVRRYGHWMREEAEKRIGHLYPKVEITEEMAKERPDLKQYVGRKLTVIAWLWARTVKSPNPAFAHVDVPLASTFMLSTKKGKEAYVEPVVEKDGYRFTVKVGAPKDLETAKTGTKLGRGANFRCVMSDTPISGDYIKTEGQAGRMGARLMAIAAEGDRSRVYLSPTEEIAAVATLAKPTWRPEGEVPSRLTGGTCVPYGLRQWSDLFTCRQTVALATFSDLVQEAREKVRRDAVAAGMEDDGKGLEDGGIGAGAYADAVGVYLGICVSKITSYHCTLCIWRAPEGKSGRAFGRQAIPMVWDYPECNMFANAGGDWEGATIDCGKTLNNLIFFHKGSAWQEAAQEDLINTARVKAIISTDPPYYDNVGYADLSDFFYVWLRKSIKDISPSLFTTMVVPKSEELVAAPYRHVGKAEAEKFFLANMSKAIGKLRNTALEGSPITIYYAFKQSEKNDDSFSSTGWETFLDAVINSGLTVCGTWPLRTEQTAALKASVNALASSVVLVCRPRPADAPTATRREFVAALKSELPIALAHLQRGNIAPVDLAQSAIGPGMAVFTRYSRILDADGKPLSVRDALMLINQILDEVLAEQEGDFDADTRWAVTWFEQCGFDAGEFGQANVLAQARNTSVAGLEQAGILLSKSGKVRLLRPDELPEGWDPTEDSRLTVWEMVHQLIRSLDQGEAAAASLVAKLGAKAETARELAYRLYNICERKKRAQEALAYNSLVQSWPEIVRLARESGTPKVTMQQGTLIN